MGLNRRVLPFNVARVKTKPQRDNKLPDFEQSLLELEALVAIVVYGLVAWGLAKLAWLLLGETRSGVRTHSRTVDTDSR